MSNIIWLVWYDTYIDKDQLFNVGDWLNHETDQIFDVQFKIARSECDGLLTRMSAS